MIDTGSHPIINSTKSVPPQSSKIFVATLILNGANFDELKLATGTKFVVSRLAAVRALVASFPNDLKAMIQMFKFFSLFSFDNFILKLI